MKPMNNTDTQTVRYTPGPWHVDTKVTGHRFDGEPVAFFSVRHTSAVRDYYIAREIAPTTLRTAFGQLKNDEAEANAHLIAAAPELLEELRKAIDFSERNPFCSLAHYIENAPGLRAAIAKAEGRSS